MPSRWSGRPAPTSGPAWSLAIHSSPAGHRNSRRSTSSRSVLAVAGWMVARSTQTWPSRGARTRTPHRAGQSRRSSRRADRAERRPGRRPCEHAGLVELAEQSPGTPGEPVSNRSVLGRGHGAAAPVEQVAQRLDQRPVAAMTRLRRGGRRPRDGPDCSSRARTGRARHRGRVRVVVADPPPKVAVQRHRVEQRLQRIVGGLHLGDDAAGR